MTTKADCVLLIESEVPHRYSCSDNKVARLIVSVLLVFNFVNIAFGYFGIWQQFFGYEGDYNDFPADKGAFALAVAILSKSFAQLTFVSTLYDSAPAIFVEVLMLYGSFTKRPFLYYPFLVFEFIQVIGLAFGSLIMTGISIYAFFLTQSMISHVNEGINVVICFFMFSLVFASMTAVLFYVAIVIPNRSFRYLEAQKNL